MREIKFRAWDVFYKKFTYSDDCGSDAIDNRSSSFFRIVKGARASSREVPLMQHTGLKDFADKEIYEGDIVVHAEYPTPLLVKLDYDQWGLFDDICNEASIDGNDVEVIGDIYENPELCASGQNLN